MNKILVSGASGFLGSAFMRICSDRSVGFSRKPPESNTDAGARSGALFAADITDLASVQKLMDKVHPEFFCHFAAISQIAAVNADRRQSRAINVEASAGLARLCQERGIRFLFTSTDLVFDGARAPYAEDSPALPCSEYGRQKLAAEQAVLQVNPAAVVVRLPLMYGPSPAAGNYNFTEQMYRQLRSGESVRLFADEFRTPVSVSCAVGGVLQALEWPSGIYHLGGRERLSRHQMGVQLAEVFGLDKTLAEAMSVDELPEQVRGERARDASLTSDKAFALGYQPLPFKQGIRVLL